MKSEARKQAGEVFGWGDAETVTAVLITPDGALWRNRCSHSGRIRAWRGTVLPHPSPDFRVSFGELQVTGNHTGVGESQQGGEDEQTE